MKKTVLIILISVGLVVSICLGFFAYAATNEIEGTGIPAQIQQKLFSAGLIDKRPTDISVVVALGKDIKIYADEVDRIAKQYELWRTTPAENSKQSALNYLIKLETLYHAATEAGIDVSDNEVSKYIDKQIENAKNIQISDKFAAYLESMDMTVEEYWNSQTEILKKELVMYSHKGNLELEYRREVGDDFTDEKWIEEYKKITDNLIEEQNISYFFEKK